MLHAVPLQQPPPPPKYNNRMVYELVQWYRKLDQLARQCYPPHGITLTPSPDQLAQLCHNALQA